MTNDPTAQLIEHVRALLDTLPKCNHVPADFNEPQCTRPATREDHDVLRCDEHTDHVLRDAPWAPHLRNVQAWLKANTEA